MRKILFHKYEVLRSIAEGGMGCVYLVKDLHLNKLAAVKIHKHSNDWGGERINQKAVARAEAKVLMRLSHPALPKIIDSFEEDNKVCIVMEYVEGITLEQYLRKMGKVEMKQAVLWAIELAEVLVYLHNQKPTVIYRDLKPANIMIGPGGELKLIDFGVAYTMSDGTLEKTFFVGTPGYGAPEQWKRRCAYKESDIYALGAVLHEMLTGMSPLGSNRKAIREYDRTFSRKLERIIMTCTQKKVSKRYHSAQQVRDALWRFYKKETRKRNRFSLIQKLCIVLIGVCVLSHIILLDTTEARDTQNLKVEMRDEQYRKLLVRNNAVYQTENGLRFEIAKDNLPDEKISLQIVAIGEDNTLYESRVFLVEKN